ncbi:hypothetical protein EN933_29555, partial [Mesorhizobium sp. M7A.F.Ca.US.001.01.1.1]
LGAGADTHWQAHMGLAAGLQVLQLDRLFEFHAIGALNTAFVADGYFVDIADGVVAAIGVEPRCCAAVDQLFRQALERDAFKNRRFGVGLAVQDRHHGGTVDDRRNDFGQGGRVEVRHGIQQPAQVGVVPGFDAPRRQAVLDRLDGVVALQHHRAVAGQQRQPVAERVDQRCLGRCPLRLCVHVHRYYLWHLTLLRRSRRHSHWLPGRAPATCRLT